MNLNLKAVANLKIGETYSICLKGARSFRKEKKSNLVIYYIDPSNTEIPKEADAVVQSFKQLPFITLNDEDCSDNYNVNARSVSSLESIMREVYPTFDEREIVTLVQFKIEDIY